MTAADWVLVGALAFHYHWPSFTSKSRREEVVKYCLGCGLSELVHRLPGAKTLPPLEPAGSRRREQGCCVEFFDSGKDDECQVGDNSPYLLLYLHVCICGSFGKSDRINAHALEKLQKGRLDSLFKEEEH